MQQRVIRNHFLQLLLLSQALLPSACGGVSEPNITIINAGGGAGTDNTGSGGAQNTGGADNPNQPCKDGQRRCGGPNGTTAEKCELEEWVIEEDCGGSTPVCSAGVCAAFHMHGSLDSLGIQSAPAAPYVLKEQTLSFAPRICSTAYCVTGGLR